MASQRVQERMDSSGSPNRVLETMSIHDDDSLQTTSHPIRWFMRWIRRIVFEITPLLIIAGFFWLQYQIGARVEGTLNTVLTVMSVIIEIGLIFLWSLFIRA